MVWIDFILVSLIFLITSGYIMSVGLEIRANEYDVLAVETACYILLVLTLLLPFVVIDKGAGVATGIITSVNKNYFGTTAIYIKSGENIQEKYCIENEKIDTKAHNYIGKKVNITYGQRVGLYSFSKCHSAPIDSIITVK